MKTICSPTIVLGLLLLIVCTELSAQSSSNLQINDPKHKTSAMQQILIDKFIVPAVAKEEFVKRLTLNLDLLRSLPGLIETTAYEQTGGEGEFNYVTTAVWESEDVLKNAKKAVKAEYQKQGFDPQEMFSRLNIKMDRALYKERIAVPQTSERNKETIRRLYEDALNKRNFELLEKFVAQEFESPRGGHGPSGFAEAIQTLIQAFPDIQWNVEELIGEGNIVVVTWEIQGSHTGGQFRNIPATGKTVSNKGIGIYELKNGKVTNTQIQTDRLGFLQQLEVLPMDLSTLTQPKEGE